MSEPMMVHGMRRHPEGEVRHIPGGGVGMSGTSTRGFLTELDDWIAGNKAAAWDEGYRAGDESSEGYLQDNPYRTPPRDSVLDSVASYSHLSDGSVDPDSIVWESELPTAPFMSTTDQVKHAIADWNHPLASSQLANAVGVWLDDNNLAVIARAPKVAGDPNE